MEWEQRKKSRAGGGAPCEFRKTVFRVPCPVANDSCHDQARAWLLGDVAEREKSSSVAGAPVISYSFCRLCHASHISFSLLVLVFLFTGAGGLSKGVSLYVVLLCSVPHEVI